MKLISLNTWGGKYFEPLIDFIKHVAEDTDIFCFQEIYDTKSDIKQHKGIIRANLLHEIKSFLVDFNYFYFPTLFGFDDKAIPVNFDLSYGPAIFIKKEIEVNSQQDYFIYREKYLNYVKNDFSNLATPLQFINFNFENEEFSVFNFHGTPFPSDKLDSKNRLEQTKKVKKIMDSKSGAKVIVGDFNLLPQTESLKIIGAGMRNLISEFNIKRTRSNLSPYSKKPTFQKFADYTFVSSDVMVKDFKVVEVEVSDHLPMILEFE